MAAILVVEDDPMLRRALDLVIRRAGHQPVLVEDGEAAIAALKARPFAVMVTDIIMSGQEGLETILQVRRGWPACRIVAMSGGGSIGSREVLTYAKLFGAAATLEKPFETSALLAAIEAALELQPSAPA